MLDWSTTSLKGGFCSMETIGAYEAKTHLPKLLERVMKGERITITKHGVPVAVLQPAESRRRTDPKQVIAELREFRQKHSLDGLSLRDMIEEGRR
jgi:prevent-host-death family protein